MNKKSKSIARVIAILTIACMFFTVVPPMEASAAMTDKTYVETMTVGNNAGDSVIITKTEPYTLNIQCTHSLEYAEMDVRVYALGTKEYVKVGRVRAGLGAGETWNEDFFFDYLSPGNYRLTVYKKDAYESSNLQYRPYVDRITVVIDANGVNLVDYAAVSNQNKTVRAKGSTSSYKDKALTDFKYMLFNRTINSSTESAYYKKISDQIVSAGDSDYTKLYKIYTYVAENLYYDNYKSSKPYDDPYNNLKHINSTSGSGYNWSGGKVAAQCDGYAGLFIALARAQDIPARMVGGNLLSSTTEAWETVGTVKNNTHCWVQAYADGRWIEIDPCRATLSTRNSDGSWTKARQINYMFFDMNDVQMAHTHCSVEFMGNAEKLSQTISVKQTKYTKTYGNSSFKLNASSKTSKSYKSSNSNVVKVSSGTVKILGPGKATITITAEETEKYKKATKKVYITVKPKKVTGVSLKAAKKKMTVKWKKGSKVSGYQIAYTTDKNFKKNIKYKTVSSSKAVKSTISKLKSKKYYYVKVRAYKKSGSDKIYGSYGSVKKVKVK